MHQRQHSRGARIPREQKLRLRSASPPSKEEPESEEEEKAGLHPTASTRLPIRRLGQPPRHGMSAIPDRLSGSKPTPNKPPQNLTRNHAQPLFSCEPDQRVSLVYVSTKSMSMVATETALIGYSVLGNMQVNYGGL